MMRRWIPRVCTLLVPSVLGAQSLASRIDDVGSGLVRFSFDARAGVCGNGRNISTNRSTSDWEPWCEPGPVRVVVELRNGQAVDVDTYVGGRWRTRQDPFTDLGTVEPADAVAYLLSVARDGGGSAPEHAVLPIALADLETVGRDAARAAEAASLRRLERDIHDGPQQRLPLVPPKHLAAFFGRSTTAPAFFLSRSVQCWASIRLGSDPKHRVEKPRRIPGQGRFFPTLRLSPKKRAMKPQ